MKKICTYVVLGILTIFAAGCATVPPEEAALLNNRCLWEKEVPATAGQSGELPQLSAKSTLHDYLVYAALHNPGLKAAFLRWKAALEKIPQVTALPDPHFTFTNYFVSVETRVGPQNYAYAMTQTFPWFGKLQLKGNAASEAARSQKALFDAAKLKLFYEVKDAYYEYYYLARAIAVNKENLGYMKYLESVARAGYASGIVSYADVVRAQVELGKEEDRLKTLNDEAEPVAAKLNAALNRASDAPLTWPEKLKEQKVAVTSGELLKWLNEYNPDLKAIAYQAAGAKWNIALAKKNYYPDVTLGLMGIDTGPAMIPTTPDSGKDPIIGSVSINVPIWWSKYRAEEREAADRYEAFLRERANRENTLHADVKFALYKFRDANRKIVLYRKALIPEAKKAFQVSVQSYQTGKETFTGVADSIRVLLQFELSYERAFVDREQSLAKLEMLVGRNIPRAEK
ncbi:MAG: TolC family protein [Syntrophobacteraceae bacterium]